MTDQQQTLVDYMRTERHHPCVEDFSMDKVAEAACVAAYRLTETMDALWQKRRACLQQVADLLCPFPVGSVLKRVETGAVPTQLVVVAVLPCRPDYQAPYALRVRALRKDGTLAARESFLHFNTPVALVDRYLGTIPPSDWIEDKRV
jgi:hypothetical protein